LRTHRGIAGSLLWVNFDRHGLLDMVWKLGGQFVANIDDVRPQFATPQSVYLSQNAIFNSTLVRANGVSASASVTALNGSLSTPMTSVDGMKQLAKPSSSDQILPFDQVLRGENVFCSLAGEGWSTAKGLRPGFIAGKLRAGVGCGWLSWSG
jgi:hypothetical protein